jgi:hypothetical protein
MEKVKFVPRDPRRLAVGDILAGMDAGIQRMNELFAIHHELMNRHRYLLSERRRLTDTRRRLLRESHVLMNPGSRDPSPRPMLRLIKK